jgi:hypothetical protein
MKGIVLAAAVLALLGVDAAQATPPPPGGARPVPPVAGARPPGHWGGGAYHAPRPPVYGGGWGYYGPRPGWYGGWYGGYWGPRAGVYLGTPWYWGAWPYPAAAYAWGVPYTWGAPYAYTYGAPWVVGSTPTVPPEAWMPSTAAATLPAAPAPSPAANFWYYCPQPQGYFPYVKDCSQGWLKVVPQAPGESNTPPSLAP